MLPLTVITSLFGMNVAFPGFGSREAFWVIVGVMIAALVGMIGFFRYKRWI
jgi:Mg2+ and Co2+ transporter CorA